MAQLVPMEGGPVVAREDGGGGKAVIENWTWHGPTVGEGVDVQSQEGEMEVVVEYFQIDGHAVLKLVVEPAD